MLYNLGYQNTTVYLSLEQILDLTDDDLRMLVATNSGEVINNFLHGSCLAELLRENPQDEEDEIDDEQDEGFLFDAEELGELLENSSFDGD